MISEGFVVGRFLLDGKTTFLNKKLQSVLPNMIFAQIIDRPDRHHESLEDSAYFLTQSYLQTPEYKWGRNRGILPVFNVSVDILVDEQVERSSQLVSLGFKPIFEYTPNGVRDICLQNARNYSHEQAEHFCHFSSRFLDKYVSMRNN
ncbi:MAG: hypothetical protein ACMXYF_00225 [Candidatus Woesearchaeota archaeon]